MLDPHVQSSGGMHIEMTGVVCILCWFGRCSAECSAAAGNPGVVRWGQRPSQTAQGLGQQAPEPAEEVQGLLAGEAYDLQETADDVGTAQTDLCCHLAIAVP